MDEQKLNEITYALYDEGFQDGQFAMITSIEKLGLITVQMADLLRGVLWGNVTFADYFSDSSADIKAKQAAEKIRELMEPKTIRYGGFIEINDQTELKPLDE